MMTQKKFLTRIILFISIVAFFTALSFFINEKTTAPFVPSLTGAVVDTTILQEKADLLTSISSDSELIYFIKNNEIIEIGVLLSNGTIQK